MSKRLLPKDGTPEAEIVKERYLAGDEGTLATELGFANVDSLRRSIGSQYKFPTPDANKLSDLEKKVLSIIKQKSISVGEISRRIDRSSETVIKLLDSLREKHYAVELDKISRLVDLPAEPKREFTATTFKYYKSFYRIGLISDTHLGSKYQQLTALYDAYKIFDEKDVDFILHAGDIIDGVDMYRGQAQEIFQHGADDQRKYAVEVYPKPQKAKLKTYVIGGQHDRSFYRDKGYDIVEHICEEREDLVYRGFFSAQFEIKGLPIRLEHPGSGVAYARSYAPQKIIENMMGYINTSPSAVKPVFMAMGHWHTPLHLPVYMGVDAVTLPCFQSQTPFMQQHKNMMPTVGCAIAEIYLNENNQLSSVKVEFIVMNDRIKEKDY